jgi:hypothetical protein
MAENKKSFILYTDLIHVVRKLVLKDRENNTNYAGELFLHILEYVNDTDPIPINFIVEMSFEPIKQTLKRDLMKYRIYIEKQRENGKRGGRPKKPKKPNPLSGNPSQPKKADSVSDSVNDNTLSYKSEREFLADWKKAREAILKLPTNIQKLNLEESRIFQDIKDNYSIDYFRNAMQGLFVQKNMYALNQLRPTHFFRDMNYEKYNDCFVNKRQLFEDKKQQQKL